MNRPEATKRRRQSSDRRTARSTGIGVALTLLLACSAGAQDLPLIRTLDSRWPLAAEKLTDDSPSLVALRIPVGLYVVARDDLADVRLLAVDGKSETANEIPYAIWLPADVDNLRDLDARRISLDTVDGDTHILTAVAAEAADANEIRIEIAEGAGSYQRDVSVYGSMDTSEPGELLTDAGLLFGADAGGRKTRICRIEFPKSAFQIYRVVIRNGGDPPLPVDRVRVLEHNRTAAPRTDLPAAHINWNLEASTGLSVIAAELHVRNVPLNGVRLDVASDFDFCRTAHLEITNDPTQLDGWRRVKTFDLYGFRRGSDRSIEQTTVMCPETRGGYFRVSIENGRDRPVTVRDMAAISIDRWMVCEATRLTDPDRQVAIYAGDRHRSAPDSMLASEVEPFDADLLTNTVELGGREANPYKLPDYDPDLFEPGGYRSILLWTLMGLVVIAVGTTLLRRRRQQRAIS